MDDEENLSLQPGEDKQTESGGSPEASEEDKTGSKAKPKAKEKQQEQLTAESVSAMIQSAFDDFVKQQEKQKTEAEKLSGMNEQQRTAYERDSYKEELEALKQKIALSEMQSAARGMLAEENIHAPDGIVERLVTGDAETTKQNVDAFVQLFRSAVDAEVKNRIKGDPPKRGGSNGRLTKEQILAIKDDSKRIKTIRENMDLFQ